MLDIAIPITGGSIALAIIITVGRSAQKLVTEKIRRWDQHLVECAEKTVNHVKLENKVDQLSETAREVRTAQVWQGDCLITLGTAMSVKLPERPR